MKLSTLTSIIAASLLPLTALAAFRDVSSNHANAEAIAYVESEGIVSGYPDGTYKPDSKINRAEFTKIIVGATFNSQEIAICVAERVAGKKFPDVPASAWFAGYVCTAVSHSIVAGYADGTFKPEQQINFAEAAKIIVNSFSLPSSQGDVWYEGYVRALADAHAIPTSISSLDAPLTRGDMAEIVYRVRAEVTSKPSKSFGDFGGSAKASGAQYASYREGVIGSGQESVLFFHAGWCPYCKAHDTALSAWSAAGELSVPVYKVNYDAEANLKADFDVTYQHTFVRVDGQGRVLGKITSPSDGELKEFLAG